jgi:alpha-tubulin suppressor-like RCC1 family protein
MSQAIGVPRAWFAHRFAWRLAAGAGVWLASQGAQALTPVAGVQAVAAGESHACLIDGAGGVQCWGANGEGQLGDGSFSNDRSLPTAVVGLSSGVAALALGGRFSCALLVGGGVSCWGQNGDNQLGSGAGPSRATPLAVSGLGGTVQKLVAGDAHVCAILAGGALQCWGRNDDGQLGDNSNTNRPAPTPVSGLGAGVTAAAAGFAHSCAVVAGAVRCWGDNVSGGLGDGSQDDRLVPTPVSGLASGWAEVSAGNRWSCARSSAGALRCWGHNADAELGDGTFEQRLLPVQVSGLQSGVRALRSGFSASCAVLDDDSLRCWGQNARGQLGDGTLTRRPLAVTPIDQHNGVASVAVGGFHACSRRTDGSLHCWGFNAEGQLGDGAASTRPSPVLATGLGGGALDVEAGYQFGCAATATGSVRCWGESSIANGQVVDGLTLGQRVPTTVAGVSGIARVASGESHACALSQGGGVVCWGLGFLGQLGDGNAATSFVPVTPVGLASGVLQVVAGGNHSCALLGGGTVRCWGHNFHGQLGDDSNSDRPAPVAVAGLSGVTAIAAGWRHTCAVIAGGAARCWGDNVGDGFAGGQLGDGTRNSSDVPVAVLAPGVVFTRLSGGGNMSCGLTSIGAALCWGENGRGQLGDGTTTDRLVPTPVLGLDSGVLAISAGGLHPFLDEHACAVDGNGAVWCWGGNRFGQIGDGSTVYRDAPAATGLSAGMVDVSAGGTHSCARSAGGAVLCWGYDQYGQVGDGSRDPTRAAPVVSEPRSAVLAVSDGAAASGAVASDAAGRYLLFESADDGLVPGDSNGATDIFRRDTVSGALERVSLDDDEGQIAGASIEPAISANGQYAVLVAPDAAVGKLRGEGKAARERRRKASGSGIFLRNIVTGSLQRVGTALPGGAGSQPQLSPEGLTLVYTALPQTPQQGDVTREAIFLQRFALVGNELVPQTPAPSCVSCKAIAVAGVETGENAGGASRAPVLSADGTWLAFESAAKNLLDGVPSPCPGPTTEILLRNLVTGAARRVSPPPGTLACGSAGASQPSIDYSGQHLVYQSDAPLGAGDANLAQDIYLFDTRGITERISNDAASRADANGDSLQPSLSGDGRSVVFRSMARNLESALPDNNETDDIVAVRLDQRSSRLLSRSRRGDQGNAGSRRPRINYAGTHVAFDSDASNLVLDPATGLPLDGNGVRDVFAVANIATADIVFRSGME